MLWKQLPAYKIKKSNFTVPYFIPAASGPGCNRRLKYEMGSANTLVKVATQIFNCNHICYAYCTCGWEMGFIVGARRGLHKLFMASVKRQICLGLHFPLGVCTHSKWEVSGLVGPVGRRVEDVNHSHTKAEACSRFMPVPQSFFNHANATIRNLSHFFCPKKRQWLIPSRQRWIRYH